MPVDMLRSAAVELAAPTSSPIMMALVCYADATPLPPSVCQGGSPSLLWPNLIDALYALLRAFSEPQHQGMSQQWVFGALRDDQVCAALGEEVGAEDERKKQRTR